MSGRDTEPGAGTARQPGNLSEDARLILAAFRGALEDVQRALASGADVNAVDPDTGLSALHIAVGQNDLALCRFLIEEQGARLFADRFGRMPSVVAIDCRADDDVFDFIAEKEIEAEGRAS